MSTSSPAPKVFVSYSWTSDEHIEWVADLATRLMSDGIDVILDRWSLQDGQDLNAFMEQMVKDSSVRRVIIVSDSKYSVKADDRKGGVGTETQIISAEVYSSVDQTKFIPILRERDENGSPCLPIYLKSRKYIDFSSPDNYAVAYDQLIRNIFDRPVIKKPTLGRPPSHIFDDNATVVTSAQKGRRFREVVTNGKGNPIAAFDDFADEFILNFEDLRLTYSGDGSEAWCKSIRENIEKASAYRDVYIDVIRAGCVLSSEDFVPRLLLLLERLLPFRERPISVTSYFEHSEDNYKLLCYEIFLYTIAVFVKAKKYRDVRMIVDYQYVAPGNHGGNNLRAHKYSEFNQYANSIENQCNGGSNGRRYSVMADMIHDRADHSYVKFSDVLQADVLLWLIGGVWEWYPRTLVYGFNAGKLELFVRAATADGFEPLRIMLKIDSPREMLKRIFSEDYLKVLTSERHVRFESLECLNLDALKRVWLEKNS